MFTELKEVPAHQHCPADLEKANSLADVLNNLTFHGLNTSAWVMARPFPKPRVHIAVHCPNEGFNIVFGLDFRYDADADRCKRIISAACSAVLDE